MTNVVTSTKKSEIEYLREIRHKFVEWSLARPVLTDEEEAILASRQTSTTAAPAAVTVPDTELGASIATKYLKAILDRLRESNFQAVTGQLKGLARLLCLIRDYESFLRNRPLVTAYARILLWFFRAASHEKELLKNQSSENKNLKNAERGRDWALGELGLLLGRKTSQTHLAHARVFGLSLKDVDEFLKQKDRQNHQESSRESVDDSPPLDEATLDTIQDFLLEAFEVYTSATGKEESTAALLRWLNEGVETEEENRSDDDSPPRRFVLNHRGCPHVAAAVTYLAEELRRNFPPDEFDVDYRVFQEILFKYF